MINTLSAIAMIMAGAMLIVISFGMWVAIRKYPQPDMASDKGEAALRILLLAIGVALISLGRGFGEPPVQQQKSQNSPRG